MPSDVFRRMFWTNDRRLLFEDFWIVDGITVDASSLPKLLYFMKCCLSIFGNIYSESF
jgi:hypothetical protein